METIEQRVQQIENRNRSVQADKAWETSWTRRALLAAFTYLAIGAYLWAIQIERQRVISHRGRKRLAQPISGGKISHSWAGDV